ncbi:ATP-binding cassette domain-containing protein [Dinghuibacter silviterrae]|uniref:Molybdate transport system ATP-binding protein n=1 Tax=Dinghuibacter silviterrae TaxID=1539049 RepID=A0A4R8DJG0_9BACT|nr:ATP-binding cassette domain-containing protein [Dinghuibacter silviterrae]TDW97326.1 molybdate transport system ATP-binding protein [Dinghuibacter silviterrae]
MSVPGHSEPATGGPGASPGRTAAAAPSAPSGASAGPAQGAAPFLSAELLTIQAGARPLLTDLTFVMGRGEHWVLTGHAGVGKSTLGKALCGLIFHRGALHIDYAPLATPGAAAPRALFVDQWHHFKDHTGLSSQFYYQQRYNSQDAENAVTLLEELLAAAPGAEAEAWGLLRALHVDHRAYASLVQLSSGEHKKLQLARAFISKPQLLVLDNPYLGLDTATCANLEALFEQAAAVGTQLIIIGDTANLPSVVTHIATLSDGSLEIVPKAAYQLIHSAPTALPPAPIMLPAYLRDAPFSGEGAPPAFATFLRMEHVHVQYEHKLVLDNIDWTVRRGEHWWLKGHNGAGKSTLLSLVVGDNPQAYANPIYLFDKKRGSGESIWDLKKKIGYISPELHWYFDQQTTCAGAIATGFFDTTGLYRAVSEEQREVVNQWLEVFDLTPFRDKRLQDLSIGRQRLTLLARALVKNPPVLILDEPCQGLDEDQAAHFIRVVDKLMEHPGRTLLYVSHRLDQLPKCIDHVLALEAGRQVEKGPYHYKTQTVQR